MSEDILPGEKDVDTQLPQPHENNNNIFIKTTLLKEFINNSKGGGGAESVRIHSADNRPNRLKLSVSEDIPKIPVLHRAKSDNAIVPINTTSRTHFKTIKYKKKKKKKFKKSDLPIIFPGNIRPITIILPTGGKKGIIPQFPSETLYNLLQRVCHEIGLPSVSYNFKDHTGSILTDLSKDVNEAGDVLYLVACKDEGPPSPAYIPPPPPILTSRSTSEEEDTVSELPHRNFTIYCPHGVKRSVMIHNVRENLKGIVEKTCREKGLVMDNLCIEDIHGNPIQDLETLVINIPGDMISLIEKAEKEARKSLNSSPQNNRAHGKISNSRGPKSLRLSLTPKFELVRSLTVTILEMKGIITTNPVYALIEVEGDLHNFVTPSVIMDKEDNFWGQNYHFENPPLSSITIKFIEIRPKINKKNNKTKSPPAEKRVKEKSIATYTTKLSDFPLGNMITEWYPMSGPLKDTTVRLKIHLTETPVLPHEEYHNFVAQLVQPDMRLIILMEAISKISEWVDIAKPLMHILHNGNCWHHYLERVITEEIKECTNEGTLFRSNSLGITALRIYLEYIGKVYIQNTLSPHIKHIITSKLPCDLKPSDPNDYDTNVSNLLSHLTLLMDSIYTSSALFSAGMKYLFRFLRSKAEEKFGQHAGITAVTGFLFLRFLVPAIRDPLLFGIWASDIEAEEKRTLNSLAQLIQKIANLSAKFRSDDVYSPFSQYIEETSEKFLKFIDEISIMEDIPRKNTGSPLNPLIAYDAACLVQFFNQHTEYYHNNKDDPDVILILQLLDPINKASGTTLKLDSFEIKPQPTSTKKKNT